MLQWSDPGSINLISETSWFDKGSFSFSRYGATVGRLEDESDIRVYTLLDTDATKPILHKRFYERTPFMHTYPKDFMKEHPSCIHIQSTK